MPTADHSRARRLRLRIWHKLCLIALAFLVPLTLATIYLVQQQNSNVAAIDQELQGTNFLRPLSALTLDLLQFRSLSTQAAYGHPGPAQQLTTVEAAIDGDLARLTSANPSLQRELGATLNLEGKSQLTPAALADEWAGIKATGPVEALSANFTPQLIGNVLALYSYAGDASMLDRDPQLDTYYTGTAMLALEPPLVNHIGLLGDGLITALQTGNTAAASGQVPATMVLLNQQQTQLGDALGRAFNSTPGDTNDTAFRPSVAPLLERADTSVNALIAAANAHLASGNSSGVTLTEVQTLMDSALQANTQLWNAMFDYESHMLHTRISASQTRNALLLGTIGTGLALIVTLTTLISRNIARNLSHVADAAQELSAGNLDRRAQVVGGDEIATLAATFNTMADNLQESYNVVENRVHARTAKLHLLQGVATAANKAATWDEALATGLPLICDYMGWPAARAYNAETAPAQSDGAAPAATGADRLTMSPSWYPRGRPPRPLPVQVGEPAASRSLSPVVARAHQTGMPQGPEPLAVATGWTDGLPQGTKVLGAVAFPALIHQGSMGVVEFWTTSLDELDDATLTLVAGLVSQLGRVREREVAARALESAADAAEDANRAKGAFLATMSHEIRTPMNAVMGTAELMMGTSLDQEQREYAETINSSADSLLAIINDILDYSKVEAGKVKLENTVINLRECAESAFELITPKAREKPELDLACLIESDLPDEIVCDALRLRQIIVNLLGNAIKFTEVGEIVLTASRTIPTPGHAEGGPTAPPDGRPATEADAFTVHFSVRDTGVGIPADRIGQLFQPFEQLDSSTTRRYGGTGLGLAISRRLVELMGGTIWAESEPGRGSTFHFTIATREAPGSATSRREPPTALRGKRLLAVTDSQTSRMIIIARAEAWGMRVRATGSPDEALTWIRDGDHYDIAVVDKQIPHIDGIALAKEIRRHRAGLPMILLTSLGKPDDPDELSLFSGFQTKPIKVRQLYGNLRRALAPKTPAEPSQPTTSPAPSPEPTALRILLAEDNKLNQRIALRMLTKIGYSADVVGDGTQVLEALHSKSYDIVLMDVHMPVMNGLDASRAIHREWPDHKRPRIIAMTASAMREDLEACVAAGMDECLTKPLGLSVLADALARFAPHTPGPGLEVRDTTRHQP